MSDIYQEMTEYLEKNCSRLTTQIFDFGPWTMTAKISHILASKCVSPVVCSKVSVGNPEGERCTVCRYEHELKLPRFPDMTFAFNFLKVEHQDGFGFEFNCLDALHNVTSEAIPTNVAVAEKWQEARADNNHSKEIVKPFDWTFTTKYKGTLLHGNKPFNVCEATERIDIEKLKVKEQIMFYEDIHLYEDELADNGVAQCAVKIRVMKDSFFILLRYFLRIDDVMVRLNESRIYHELGKNYLLREYTSKESKASDLNVPISVLINPAELGQHLPLVEFCYEKFEFPEQDAK